MIDENGNYHCDFCSNSTESGEFYTATGNHVSCTELRERVRLEKENATLRAENARLADEVRRLEYKQP